MAYESHIADRLRARLSGAEGISERKMFGGIAFMLHGNMVCGVHEDRIMLRLGPDQVPAALEREGVEPMSFTGRVMKGFAMLHDGAAEGLEADLVEQCLSFAASLPPK